jgi:hypothetical protein
MLQRSEQGLGDIRHEMIVRRVPLGRDEKWILHQIQDDEARVEDLDNFEIAHLTTQYFERRYDLPVECNGCTSLQAWIAMEQGLNPE